MKDLEYKFYHHELQVGDNYQYLWNDDVLENRTTKNKHDHQLASSSFIESSTNIRKLNILSILLQIELV